MPSRRTRRSAVLAAGCTLAGIAIAQSPAVGAAAATPTAVRPFAHHTLGTLGSYATVSGTTAGAVTAPVTRRFRPFGRHTLGVPGTYAAVRRPASAKPSPAATTSPSPSPAAAPAAASVAAPAPAAVVATTPPAVDPAAMPVGDQPGWKQVVAENFNGSTLPSGWGKYYGTPGSAPDGWWEPSHVTVSNGAMHLLGYKDNGRWTTGGVMNSHAAETTYGKYEVRFRMTKGTGVKYAILLWPQSDRWPIDGEIDFAEDGGGNRTHTSATMHYGSTDHIIQREVFSQDFSTWNTVGVEWTPGKIVYTLNGKVWGTVESSNVPSGPMDLAIQTETGTCGDQWLTCPDATTPSRVDLDVDWVAVWQRV